MSQPHPTNPGEPYDRVAVVGAGAWGTALALVAAANVRQVLLWAREPDVVAGIHGSRENRRFLPDVRLPENVEPVSDLGAAVGCEAVLLVSPAQHIRETAEALRRAIRPAQPIVLCAKGIEHGTGKLLTEVLADALPDAEI